jgi:capsular exopolysaccharide synthesis family protein
MFDPNQPARNALAPYQPRPAEAQRVDDFSFRFGEGESLKGVWSVVRKRKIGIAVAGCLGLALAIAACMAMSRQYLAVATIEVGKTDAAQTSLRLNAVVAAPSSDEMKTDIATHIKVLQSPAVLLSAVRDLKLQQEAPFAYRPSLMGTITGANAHIEDEMKRGLPLEEAPYSRDRILAIFAKKLKVENTPDTRLITVSYLNPNADRAAAIANAIVQEYVTYEAHSQASTDSQRWLADQLADLKANYERSQGELAAFEQKTGLNGMILGSMGEGGAGSATHVPALDSLDSLNQQLITAQTDRIAKEAIYRLTKTQDPEVVASIAASAGSSNAASETAVSGPGLELLRSFRQQQAALRVTYADMLTKYGPNNQHLVETKSQLDAVNAQITEELERINERAHQEYLFAQEKEDGLRKAVAIQQQAAGDLNVSSVKLQSLSQEATSSRQLYDALYGKLKELDVQTALRAINIGIANQALPPSNPTRPNPPLYLAVGLMAGLFFGVSSAFVREHMDDTVTVALQLQGGGRLPMLANIPSSPVLKSLPSKSASLTSETSPLLNDPRSTGAESFRSLRTAIQVASQGGRLRSLLVTSPLFGEGKSTVAYNTAIAFALAGKKVLLLDADMRKPRQHQLFDRPCSPGLSDVLEGKATPAVAIHRHRTVPSLSLLPAGSETSSSAELLESAKFNVLLATLTEEYDLIIADSPPILLVSDARVLSEKFGATLAVVRARQTTHTVLKSLSSVLELSGSRAVGLVLNGVDTDSIDYFDAYGHDGKGEYLNA